MSIERRIPDDDFYTRGPGPFTRDIAHEAVMLFAVPAINALAARIEQLESQLADVSKALNIHMAEASAKIEP